MNTPQIDYESRRAFIRNGTLVLSASAFSCPLAIATEESASALRIGLVTDMHYADKPSAGTRYYRETLGKLEEASQKLKAFEPAFVVELGDFIDAADSVDTELRYLRRINKQFSKINSERHYVLGNHCVDTLKKEEFLEVVEQKRSYYSFDRNGIHFVILDSCFRSDGAAYGRKNFTWTDANIHEQELDWLKEDLKSSKGPVVVFAHQRLDDAKNHAIKNNLAVRKILESSKRVLAVFQGHSHQNDLQTIGGIHYCTLVAMVEGSGPQSNGYSLLEIASDGTIKLNGFRNQASRSL